MERIMEADKSKVLNVLQGIIGDEYRGEVGDTRSLDYSSFRVQGSRMEGVQGKDKIKSIYLHIYIYNYIYIERESLFCLSIHLYHFFYFLPPLPKP